MKIAVIGAGSTYTPELVSGLSRELDDRRDELVLHDIDAERPRVVGGMAGRMLDRVRASQASSSVTGDLDRAVDGADFVLVQIRVGGQAARLSDETIPLACGCIGQETTGAGGFAKALRTVPVVLEIAERVRARRCDGAWIVDFTNPVGIVTRALLDAGHRAIGLCNVAIGFQRTVRAAARRSTPTRSSSTRSASTTSPGCGGVRVGGDDVLPALLAEHGDELAAEVGAAAAAARRARRRSRPTTSLLLRARRGARGAARRRDAARRGRRRDRARAARALPRPGAGREAGAARAARRRVLQRGGGRARRRALRAPGPASTTSTSATTARSRGSQPTTWSRCRRASTPAAPVPLPQAPLAPELLGLAQHVAAYERLAAEAAVTRDVVDRAQGAARPSADRPARARRRAGSSACSRRRAV